MLHVSLARIESDSEWAPSVEPHGRSAFRMGEMSRIHGIVASLAVHGALILALALQPGSRIGAGAGGERLVTIDLRTSSPEANGSRGEGEAAVAAAPDASALAEAQDGQLEALRRPPAGAARGESVGAEGGPGISGNPAGLRASASEGALRSIYQSALFAHVMRYRYYPEAAMPGRLQGMVRVQFALARDGRITTAWIETSSGHLLLDNAALDALRRAEPLPPIPPELPDEMEVLLPLDYVAPRLALAG